MVEAKCHPIFTQDPAHWMQYVYKKVRVVTSAGQEHMGHVYTVDPVTFSFVLIQFPASASSASSSSSKTCPSVAGENGETEPTISTTVTNTTNIIASDATTTTINTTSATTTTINTTVASEVDTPETSSATTAAGSATTTTTATTAATDTTTTKRNVEVCVIPGHAVDEVVVLPNDDNGDESNSSSQGEAETIKARLDSLFSKTSSINGYFGNRDADPTTPSNSSIGHLSEAALKERRDRLKTWLLKNRLPVEEQGEGKEKKQQGQECEGGGVKAQSLCVAGAVTILPPYGPTDCCGTNEIILLRIQSLVQNMPTTD